MESGRTRRQGSGERKKEGRKERRREERAKIQGKFGLLLVASSLTDDWQSVSRLRGRVNVLAGPSLAWSNPGSLPAFHARLSTLYISLATTPVPGGWSAAPSGLQTSPR